MALITVYFKKKDHPHYRKAIIDENEKQFFINLGAYETEAACVDAVKTILSSKDDKD